MADLPKTSSKEEVEDTPFVKELKELDDKYLALEREYEKERAALQRKYTEKQQPFLDERSQKLAAVPDGGNAETGTPALSGFWLTALRNHPEFEDKIEEWDEPVLEYLKDISYKDRDPEDSNAGFSLTLTFAPNPYFTDETLTKEYVTEEESPYTQEITVKEVKASKIEWKSGKDVTVEKVSKKSKGAKAKQKSKEKEEPRASFFRIFFRDLTEGMDIPDDLDLEAMGADEDDDESEILGYLMESDLDSGMALRDQIIPFAVRWYTGEAAPERDDDDDEDEESELDDDDSESDDTPPGKKGNKKKGGKANKSPKSSPSLKPKGEKEECKQQ